MVGMSKQQRRGWDKLLKYSAGTRKLLKKITGRAQRKAGKQEVRKPYE